MEPTKLSRRVLWKVGVIALAFGLGHVAARFIAGCAPYHQRPQAEGATVSRAVVDRVVGEKDGKQILQLTLRSGEHNGKTLRGEEPVGAPVARGRVRAGQRCLVAISTTDGGLAAQVLTLERDGFLLGAGAALVALLAVTAGRRGLAIVASIIWAMALLIVLLLPAALRGQDAGMLSLPLALAIAAPTLAAIGGLNRKSLAAIGGTLCGLAAGGGVALGFAKAMSLTGLDTSFGPYHHLENVLWFAPPLRAVRFDGLLVAGMLLAGLGAVMDVSMAVASTVAEVWRHSPVSPRQELFRYGVRAGRDIVGVMVFSLAMVFVGTELVSFVSLGRTVWAGQWLLLANYENLAAELARAAATGTGMALCVPATAFLAALLHGRSGATTQQGAPRLPLRLPSLARPLLAIAACLVAAGLADELTLRSYRGSSPRGPSETIGRAVAFDEPIVELTTTTTDPHDRSYFRSQVVVVQPYFGPHAGELLATRMLLGPNPSSNLELRRRMAVHISAESGADGPDVKLFKPPLRYRSGLVAALVMAMTVILAGGRVGVRVIIVMAGAAALMLGVLVPLLAEGYAPLPTTAGFCATVLLAVFAIAGAVDRKALAGVAGCVAGLVGAALLLLVCGWWLGFSGLHSVSALFLQTMGERLRVSYDYTGLLAAGLLVGLLGLAMDTAVTVAAGVAQVCAARPAIGRKHALAAGLSISRDVVGTMVLTLLFAFVGLKLTVLALPPALNISAAEFINCESGASELLYALVGCACLIVTGPSAALAASLLMTGGKTHAADAPQTPRRRLLRWLVAGAVGLGVLGGAAHWWHLRAERLSRTALPTLPSDTDSLVGRAIQARRNQGIGETLLALWAARERSPGDARVRTELAYTLMVRRWTAQARREIEAALEAGADDSMTHYVAGVVYAWTDESEKAQRHLRRALELDPANATVRAALEQLFQ